MVAGKLKMKRATLCSWRCLVMRSRNDRVRQSFSRWCIFYKSRKAFLKLFAKALWHSYLRCLMQQWRNECILRRRRHRIAEAIYERSLSLARITFWRWRVHARLECVSYESQWLILIIRQSCCRRAARRFLLVQGSERRFHFRAQDILRILCV